MNEAELVREGLFQWLLLAAPAVAAVTAAAVILGGLLGRLGVRDAVASTVIRALAVVVTLIAVGEWMAGSLEGYARGVWSEHLRGDPKPGP